MLPTTLRHGHNRRGKRSRTYNCWANMRARCKPGHQDATFYHDRGIQVCERWESFDNFLADMGECPPGLTIDRKDSNGNYEPDNCRWADDHTQKNNMRSNRILEIRGDRMTMSDAARRFGVNYRSLRSRIYILGLDPEIAIFGNGKEICPLSCARKGGKMLSFRVSKGLA
jgi:hypothetical protein